MSFDDVQRYSWIDAAVPTVEDWNQILNGPPVVLVEYFILRTPASRTTIVNSQGGQMLRARGYHVIKLRWDCSYAASAFGE